MPLKTGPVTGPVLDRLIESMDRLSEVMERDLAARQREADDKRDVLAKVDILEVDRSDAKMVEKALLARDMKS